jgi:hypothetical protein
MYSSRSQCKLPSIISPHGILVLNRDDHQVLKNIAKPYEKARSRELFTKLSQIKELPSKRTVLYYKKRIQIKGRADTSFVIEFSRTKL